MIPQLQFLMILQFRMILKASSRLQVSGARSSTAACITDTSSESRPERHSAPSGPPFTPASYPTWVQNQSYLYFLFEYLCLQIFMKNKYFYFIFPTHSIYRWNELEKIKWKYSFFMNICKDKYLLRPQGSSAHPCLVLDQRAPNWLLMHMD